MANITSLFEKYVANLPINNFASKNNQLHILFIALFIILIFTILICNICIWFYIKRRRTKRELIDYPSNTLQYVRFPRNPRKSNRTTSTDNSSTPMLSN